MGPITATALVAAVDAGQAFARARSVWCRASTAPVARFGCAAFAKVGNRYLRTLLVHGARALRRSRHAQSGRLGAWLAALETRAHGNNVTVLPA